jgi:hypothetical protein
VEEREGERSSKDKKKSHKRKDSSDGETKKSSKEAKKISPAKGAPKEEYPTPA